MNEELFKALSSRTRIEMVKRLMKNPHHVSGLAQALGISVPVAAKHVKILERAKLIERKTYGKTHVLTANRARLYEVLGVFGEAHEVEVRKGTSILEVLKDVAGVGIRKVGDKEFIVSIDDEEGFYIYEVDGTTPNTSVNEYRMEKGGEITIKRLVPVHKKSVRVKIKENE